MKQWLLSFFLFPLCIGAQQQFSALRTNSRITVDAKMNEEVLFASDSTVTDFITIRPVPGLKSDRKTSARLVYDDFALYFFVTCYDVKDSISEVYTVRDDFNANADIFSIFLDTYNDHQNGFYFGITSTGVQLDGKILSGDVNDQLNLVWESEVRLSDNAWLAELKIPYSALRFSKQEIQSWNINFGRQIARIREESSWVTVNPDFENYLVHSGKLEGINHIDPPLRLSLIPYLSGYVNQEANGYGRSFFGGMDVKYGINEAFTLDVTLVPDFGQVIFDNQVLNTSPFEIQFNENRQFFTEGMELFNKSGIFYSRRIGVQAPWEVLTTNLKENEVIGGIQGMPQLYNASKLSGRTKHGLGIGVFNALSAPTVGTAFNTITNENREFLAAPLTNYNTLVLDQNLKNNSSVTLTNTNVMREGNFYDANVTAFNSNLNSKNNTFFVNGKTTVSLKYAALGNEFGYIEKNEFGESVFKSLSISLPQKDQVNSTLWSAGVINDTVVFQSEKSVYLYKYKKLISVQNFSAILHTVNINKNGAYLRIWGEGLFKLTDGVFKLIPSTKEIFAQNRIDEQYNLDNGDNLIVSRTNGIWYLKKDGTLIKAKSNQLDNFLKVNDSYQGGEKLRNNISNKIGKSITNEEAREGVSLIASKVDKFLKSQGIEPVQTETYDSELHEVISVMEIGEEKIIDVISKGYTLNGKTFRYPKIILGK